MSRYASPSILKPSHPITPISSTPNIYAFNFLKEL